MTMSTLITVIVLLLGGALLSAALVVGLALLWTARRIGDSSQFHGELDSLRTQIKNLDDFLETYRKRDAQRVSTSVQRSKREKEEDAEIPPSTAVRNGDDIVKRFLEGRSSGAQST